MFNFPSLQTLGHEPFSFEKLASNKATVVIFLQPECPFCNSYGKTLRNLDSVFTQQRIQLIGVVAGKNYPDNEIQDYMKKHSLKFTILLDPDFSLQKKLNAKVTPEAFLLDSDGKVMYRGMIDNWGYEIGKVRPQVTEHYLVDATSALLEKRPVPLDSTKAIGCYIE